MRAFFIDKYYKNSFLKLESIFVYPLSMGKIFIKEKIYSLWKNMGIGISRFVGWLWGVYKDILVDG
jgi:hypothetical protein